MPQTTIHSLVNNLLRVKCTMNFFIKPSKQASVLICQRHVSLTQFPLKTSIQRRFLLSNKENEKYPLISTSQHLVRFISVNGKEDVSRNEKQISPGLSALKSVDFRQLKCAPFPAVVYGFGGLIPFVFPPIYFTLVSYSPFLVTSQLVYGATILAFVGGIKWGNAVAKNDVSHIHIGLSTIPSLVAWGSLLVPEPIGLLVVSSGLVGALYIDLLSSSYPPWFSAMRSTLTVVAVSSLLTTMLFYVCN